MLNYPIYTILLPMKRIIICICFLFTLAISNTFAQEIGEKVYKEIIIDGKKINKWLVVYGFADYDDKGNSIYYKTEDEEWWYDIDDKGNTIHSKSSDDFECWFEYDDKGKKIHEKYSDGT